MNTHLEVRKPAFSSFLKAEVAEFASETIGIVENQDLESLLITPVFQPLKALKPEIELLSLRYGVDPERIKIETLRSKMMLLISNLKLQVRLRSKSNSDEGIYVIGSYIDTYLRHLNKAKNDKVLVQKVDGFLNATDTNEALSEAVLEHDLTSHLNSIRMALSDFRFAVSNRVTLLSGRPKVDTREIIGKVANAVNILFNGIETAQFMNPEEDYEPLINELNELVSGFRLSVNLRIANNRRKAEEEEQEQPDNSTPAPEGDEGTTEMQTTSNRSYNGFAPYSLSIVPTGSEDATWDDEDDNETEEGVEQTETDETGEG